MQRAYYQDSFAHFSTVSDDAVLGRLAACHGHDVDLQQRNAWLFSIRSLRQALLSLGEGHLLLEVAIPRMGKRADAVLLWAGMVIVLEYKVGAAAHEKAAIEQVVDYALDLKNFHKSTHTLPVLPIVVATHANEQCTPLEWSADGVAAPLLATPGSLVDLLLSAYRATQYSGFDAEEWMTSPYSPTPTIIEAARALYGGHDVSEIARSEAGATNLGATASAINAIIEQARSESRKAICFVTGVPGSGKTLAGLNLATDGMQRENGGQAVFLSGNGPLVEVLTEALARDEVKRTSVAKEVALRRARAFIQNVHHFRDESLRSAAPPPERVVIFDEAQRAWDREMTSKFMRQKRGIDGFDASEPDFLLSVMNRHDGWCVVVCLVGGGQEINTGEAGLPEWFRSVKEKYRDWIVALPERRLGRQYEIGSELPREVLTLHEPALHLDVSIRSFRAEIVSDFMAKVLTGDSRRSRELSPEKSRYPLHATRSLKTARDWLRQRARGSERYGLVASSNAMRLKAEGVHVKAGIGVVEWFLHGKEDVRSSFALEDAATEFEIQGLELDWVGVCWDANLRRESGAWSLYRFRGTRWETVREESRARYLVNAYRVLLTRARQGLVVFVPPGSLEDPTRLPRFYDETYEFLLECGFRDLE